MLIILQRINVPLFWFIELLVSNRRNLPDADCIHWKGLERDILIFCVVQINTTGSVG